MRRWITMWCLVTGLVLTSAGCDMALRPDVVESRGAPIYGGVPDHSPEHMAVVAITNGPGTGSFCTGTLITPTVVLTAGHCLEDEAVDDVWIFFGFDANVGDGLYRPVHEWLVHPDYDDTELSDDIALIRLAHSAPSDITPIPYLPFAIGIDGDDMGQTDELTLVGFGYTEIGGENQKYRAYATMSHWCPGPDPCAYGGWDINPFTFAYDQITMGTCPGDSGGPVLIERNVQTYVAGITSYGDDPCDALTTPSVSVSNLVDPYEEWVDEFIHAGGVEDCSTPGDEDLDTFADCDDPQCAADPACDTGDRCVGSPVVACDDRLNTTTEGAGAQLSDYPCVGEYPVLGPEIAYWVDAPEGTAVNATLTVGGTSDHDLVVLGSDGVTCEPDRCLAVSNNADQAAENVAFTVPAGGAYIVVDTYTVPGAFTLEVTCDTAGTPELCDTEADEDGDGLVDCADPDCANDPSCVTTDPDAGPGTDSDEKGCQQSGSPRGLPLLLLLILGALLRRRSNHPESAWE